MAMRIYDASEGGDPSLYIDDATGQFYRMTESGLVAEGGTTWQSQAKPLYDAGWTDVVGNNQLIANQEGGGPPEGSINRADTDAYRMMSGQLWAKTPAEFSAPIPTGYEGLPRRSYADWLAELERAAKSDRQTNFIESLIPLALTGFTAGSIAAAGAAGAQPAAVGAEAGAGALEAAGAFGGEAFGAAANSAGAFGGSVGPWTAGVGAATGGANMDWLDTLLKETGEYGVDAGALEGGWNGAISNAPWWSEMPTSIQNILQSAPSGNLNTVKSLIGQFFNGDASALSGLASLGIPAALLAGLFEDNKSPLVGPQTNAAFSALDAAGKFGALEPIPMMPSSARAITVANENVGNWKPYIDEGAALTRKAAGGIPSVNLDDYMNPYMDAVMPGVRREAEKLKIAQNAAAGRVGAFGGTRMAVENSLADRNLLETTGKIRMSAFDNATGLASKDLDRMGQAGAAFTNMGSTVGKLGTGDVSNLAQAGALERQPHEDKRQKLADTARLYTGVIHGTAPAVEASTDPSKLTQAAGALGALSSLSKLGIA